MTIDVFNVTSYYHLFRGAFTVMCELLVWNYEIEMGVSAATIG